MEFFDLAAGDPISPDSGLREFRYSQCSECPSAPLNSPESEFLYTLISSHPSLKTSPLEESEGHLQSLKDNSPTGEPDSVSIQRHLSNASDAAGFEEADKQGAVGVGVGVLLEGPLVEKDMVCSFKNMEHLQAHFSCSDSLGLEIYDEFYGSKVSEDCPRQIHCDPKLLEEETQVEDVGLPMDKDPHLLSSVQQLQSTPPAFRSNDALLQILLPSLGKKAGDIVPIVAEEPDIRPPLSAMQHECCAIVEDVDDLVQMWHNRKRIAPSETTNLSSAFNANMYKESKQEINGSVNSGVLNSNQLQQHLVKKPKFDNKENWTAASSRGRGTPSSNSTCLASCTDVTNENVHDLDDMDNGSNINIRVQNPERPGVKDLKPIWQTTCARREPCTEISNTKDLGTSPPHQNGKRGWVCPKSSRKQGRQQTIDAWIH